MSKKKKQKQNSNNDDSSVAVAVVHISFGHFFSFGHCGRKKILYRYLVKKKRKEICHQHRKKNTKGRPHTRIQRDTDKERDQKKMTPTK